MAELILWLGKISTGQVDLILGSSSQPRKAVLQQLGIPFTVKVSSFPENLDKALFSKDFTEYPLATSREKSRDILKELGPLSKPTVLITCDTVVLRDETHIIEKPSDADHAKELIRSLSGKQHQVVTGVVVTLRTPAGDYPSEFKCVTTVQFGRLTDDVVNAYVASGEPLNKAGGYGIQGLGALLVEELDGSFTNVIGIPLRETSESVASLLMKYYESQ